MYTTSLKTIHDVYTWNDGKLQLPFFIIKTDIKHIRPAKKIILLEVWIYTCNMIMKLCQ